ncbi:TonB family protein [Sphingomonas sp. HF-S4]|uniref:TonB family protein n=1 Tax=Sphingomonas agrestis TaxID=3080540 RepID=A0ABU3Y6F4_9SPHN|nr:TonB family protein [Sphingomonas sp. HF-S4]MDV3456960.1 TonB family protein [Sphingomonas sp. HF-S4]
MILLALLVLGERAPLTPVTVRNESELLTSDDYVTRAAGLGKSGYTVVEVFVDATGKPHTCGVAGTSGSKDLDLRACAAAVRRGKYTPAADENGVPVHGVLRLRIRWVLESFFDSPAGIPKWPADLVLEVAKLPEGRKSVTVELVYFVDEQGQIQRCSVQQSSGFQAFDTSACAAMTKLQRYPPAKDKADKIWPVVRTQRIEFTPGQK